MNSQIITIEELVKKVKPYILNDFKTKFEIKDNDVISIVDNLEIQYYKLNKKYIYEDIEFIYLLDYIKSSNEKLWDILKIKEVIIIDTTSKNIEYNPIDVIISQTLFTKVSKIKQLNKFYNESKFINVLTKRKTNSIYRRLQ